MCLKCVAFHAVGHGKEPGISFIFFYHFYFLFSSSKVERERAIEIFGAHLPAGAGAAVAASAVEVHPKVTTSASFPLCGGRDSLNLVLSLSAPRRLMISARTLACPHNTLGRSFSIASSSGGPLTRQRLPASDSAALSA